ncbi:MAG: ribonuclease Z [Clostridia bacterium]|nr:ribonuclease Z [Clostridia bacterium]
MKLTFIGTSHGVPEAEHRCSCTMIEAGEMIYFIDMGTQAVEDLRRRDIPVESVKGIFVTHMHGDHVNGLLSFVDICNWYFTGADPKIYLPTEEGINAVKTWVNALEKRPWRGIELNLVREGVIYDDGFLKITAQQTRHTRASYAYFAEADGKTALFTGDLRGVDEDYPAGAFGRTLDAVICESAHIDPRGYAQVFAKSDIKRVFINHCQPRKVPLVPELAKLCDKFPVRLATDGMEVKL